VISDAASASDCTVGGGTSAALCRSNGSAWVALGGGGGGGSTSTDRYWAPQTIGVVPSSPLSLPAANYPTLDAVIGTNTVYGIWSFANGSAQSVYGHFPLPVTPTSLIAEIRWRTADTATAHTVEFEVKYGCSSITGDPALASGGTGTANVSSTQYRWTISAITISSPSCVSGDELFFQILHHGDTDTVSANAEVALIRLHN
jgi:hypothetical protein